MRRRIPTALVAAMAVTLLVAVVACGSSPADVPAGTAKASAAGAAAASPEPAASAEPGATDGPAATDQPSGDTAAPGSSAEPAATDEQAGPAVTPGPAGTPEPSPGAEACTGSAENRDFFAAAAEAFSWDVYCPVLPEGWFVDTGSYRLADGGRLEVTYRGPGGEGIEVRQGAWCTSDAGSCAPRDHEIGPAAFGDRQGLLVALGGSESDGYAVYVDPGAAPSWSIAGSGMDEAAFTAIAAALHRVSE